MLGSLCTVKCTMHSKKWPFLLNFISLKAVETEEEDPTLMAMEVTRNNTIQRLWNLTSIYNTLNKNAWDRSINRALNDHQTELVKLVKQGFDGQTNLERWNFPTALMFTLR